MGNANGKDDIDQQVAADLKQRKDEMAKEFKILILGSGESGKSTIFKQIRILRNNGYDGEELLEHRRLVYSNAVVGISKLVKGAVNNNFEFLKENEEIAERYKGIDESHGLDLCDDFSRVYGPDIAALWKDPAVQKAFEIRGELHVEDGFEYFMKNLDRIVDPEYIPTVNDVLNARQKTLGVVEMRVEQFDHVFRFLDVGGQRNERKKWIHHFDDVTAIIYVAAMSDYNQNCVEDNKTNRMVEALNIFESVVNNPVFKKTPLILLFNKTDMFKQKIEKFPLYRYFHNYPVSGNYLSNTEIKFEKGRKFVKRMFMEKAKNKKNVHRFYTCATDTDQMQRVLQCVEELAFKKKK